MTSPLLCVANPADMAGMFSMFENDCTRLMPGRFLRSSSPLHCHAASSTRPVVVVSVPALAATAQKQTRVSR